MTIWPFVFLASLCDPAPALEGKKLFDQGRFTQAEERFRAALEQPCGPAQHAADRINLAAVLRERGATAEALRLLRETAGLEEVPADIQAHYWNSRALVEEQAGDMAAAAVSFRKALGQLTPLTPSRLCIQVLTNYARYWLRLGRLTEAELALEEARKQPGWQHDRPWAFDLNLAELRRMQSRTREAEQILRGVMDSPEASPAIRATMVNNVASLAAARGAHKEAEALWKKAIGLWREVYGPQHPTVAKGLGNLGAFYTARGRYGEAERIYREAVAMEDNPLLLNNLGALLHERGRSAEAEELYRRALRYYSAPTRDAIQLRGNLAVLLTSVHREDEALEQYRELIALLPLAVPADEPVAARFLEGYERMLRKRSAPAEAEKVAVLAMRYRVRSTLRSAN